MRERLFNWLGQDLTGQVVLDLFAGSGALGFEAASRGAKRVVLVENNRRTAASLQQQIQELRLPERMKVESMDSFVFLEKTHSVFFAVSVHLRISDFTFRFYAHSEATFVKIIAYCLFPNNSDNQ